MISIWGIFFTERMKNNWLLKLWFLKTSEAPLIQFSKLDNFLYVCWFLGKNLSNFVPPVWKLHNPYCHSLIGVYRGMEGSCAITRRPKEVVRLHKILNLPYFLFMFRQYDTFINVIVYNVTKPWYSLEQPRACVFLQRQIAQHSCQSHCRARLLEGKHMSQPLDCAHVLCVLLM